MKKNATKIAVSAAVVASAFVATAPNQADAATNVDQLVQDAQNAGTVLKWAISVEGSGDGVTQPWADYNNAKAAIAKAEAAIKGLSFSDKLKYEARLVDVKLQVSRAAAYIDAITSSKKINDLTASLNAAVATNNIDTVEAAYHTATAEFRKQTVLLDRVYGKSTRDAIRTAVKGPIEKLVAELKNDVTVNMLADAAAVDVAAGRYESASAKLADAQAILDANVLKWETTLQKNVNDVVASITPMVTSVSAINGSRIEIKFNKQVDATDLITAGKLNTTNVQVTAVGTGTAAVTAANFGAVLSADKKVLTINTDTKLEGTYSVEVKDAAVSLYDNPSKTFPGLVTTVSMTDSVKPTFSGVTYDNGTATVKFSEQLASKGTVSLDGVELAAGATTLTLDTLAVPGLTPGKTYQLSIVGATDIAGNFISPNPVTVSLTAPTDSAKPSVAVNTKNTSVTLDFSEEINTATGTVTVGTTVVPLNDVNVVQDASDKTKYTYNASALVTGDFLNTTVKVSGYKDKAGNTGDDLTTNVSFNKDITAPKFVSVTAKDAVIAAKFDEDVEPKALTAASIKYTSPDNVVKNIATSTLTALGEYDANGNTAIDGEDENYLALTITQPDFIDANGKLLPGTYQVTLAADKYTDGTNASTAPLTFSVAVAATSTIGQVVEVTSATQVAATPGSFVIDFNKDMGSSALVASNYKLDGVTLPSQSVLYFDGTKDLVRVELPAGYVSATGSRQFTVSNVLDKDGNTLKSGKESAIVSNLLENVKPTASKLSLVSDSTLTVDFSEKLQALPAFASLTGLTVKVNGVKVTLTGASLDATGKQVTLSAAAGTFTAAQAITLEISGTNVADLAGNTVTNVTLSK